MASERLRNVDVWREGAAVVRSTDGRGRFADARAERLATLLEALAEEFNDTAAVLRGRRVR